MQPPLNYPLSKLFHDLYTNKSLATQYRQNRQAVFASYELTADIALALLADDVAALAPLTNGFLLRYYFVVIGMSDPEFIRRIREVPRG
jgi:hypothetical protein